MSDLTSHAKNVLERFIRLDKPGTLDKLDIMTTVSFAFLKSAVLDWASENVRLPCISRRLCLAFRRSLTTDDAHPGVAVPDGVQVWLARYRKRLPMENRTSTAEINFEGWRILVITYQVEHLVFQLTFPTRGRKPKHGRSLPAFEASSDLRSVCIWPDVESARWPPSANLSRSTFESFHERFKTVLVRRS